MFSLSMQGTVKALEWNLRLLKKEFKNFDRLKKLDGKQKLAQKRNEGGQNRRLTGTHGRR